MKKLLTIFSIILCFVMCLCFVSCGEETNGGNTAESEDNVIVSFDAQGGTITGKTAFEIAKGEKIGEDQIPIAEKSGFDFKGWAYDEAGDSLWSEEDIFDKNTVLYAVWEEAFVTVNFNIMGGDLISGSIDIQVKRGARITEYDFPVLEMNGYDLACWSYTKNSKYNVWDEDDVFEEDTTLYAVWEETPSITISFFTAGGDVIDGKTEIQIKKDAKLSIADFPEVEREGYEFVCWSYTKNDPDDAWDPSDKFREDTTLYAVWKEEARITISFLAVGGDVIDGKTEIQIKKGEKLNPADLPEVKREYFDFVCWSYTKNEPSDEWYEGDMFYYDTTLYAVWAIKEPSGDISQKTVTITFNTGSGYFAGDEYEITIEKDGRLTDLPIPVHDNPSMEFDGWYKDALFQEAVSYSDKYSSDTTLYAKWIEHVQCIDGSYNHLWGSWEESFMKKQRQCSRPGCGAIECVNYNNVTAAVLGNNPSMQIKGSTDKFYVVPFTNLVNGKWNDSYGEVVCPKGTGEAYVTFTFVEATVLDRIYFKGEGVTSINVYVKYEGDEEFTLVGICGGTAITDETPFLETDTERKIVSVRFVETNPPQGTSKWQEVAFVKIPNEE